MKKIISFLFVFCVTMCIAAEVTITKVQQRYPWNGLVDIEYSVSEDTQFCAFGLLVVDLNTDISYVGKTFDREPPMTKGNHKITWNSIADDVRIKSGNIKVVFQELKEPLYMIVDLSGGTNAESYPISYLADMPSGGWTDEYKTDKLVLRRIKGGKIPTKNVVVTNDFFIGVFEVTERQYYHVTGTKPSTHNSVSYDSSGVGYDRRPVHDLSGATICNSTTGFVGKLCSKTNIKFNLPTIYEWEYACRAGSEGKYDGCGWIAEGIEGSLNNMAWYDDNVEIESSVGEKLPNMWGLYDMHGNIREFCLNTSGGYTLLGGCYESNGKGCSLKSGFYDNMAAAQDAEVKGFRIAASVGD